MKCVCRPQRGSGNAAIFEGVVEQRLQELGRQEQDLHLILLHTCLRLNLLVHGPSACEVDQKRWCHIFLVLS